jgi:repressor LexA
MPKPLNELERRVLDYIVEYLRHNTYQPSIREIGREFSIKSTKTVSELLHSLAVKGWIERDPSRSRGVRLLGVEMRARTVSVPVYDSPDTPLPSSHLELDRKLIAANGAYLVPMTGNHLVEAGIRPGDLLLVEPAQTSALDPGDIVMVSAGPGGGTVARHCTSGPGGPVLEPARAGEAALALSAPGTAAAVQGRVSSVIRRLRPVAVNLALAAEPGAA